MLSAMLMGNKKGSWSTTAICSLNDFSCTPFISIPSTSTLPDQGSKKRGTKLTRVLLPAPVGPTTATTSPGSTSRDTWLSTGVSPLSYPNVTSSKRICPTVEDGIGTAPGVSFTSGSDSKTSITRCALPAALWIVAEVYISDSRGP